MSLRTKPPFRAEHVGSLIRPKRLRDARLAWSEGRLSAGALREIEDECIPAAIALQQRVGLQSITDGEYRRDNWQEAWSTAFDGFAEEGTLETMNFFTLYDGTVQMLADRPALARKLTRRGRLGSEHFSFFKDRTSRTAKMTVPSPSMMHSGTGDAVFKGVYPDRHAFMADITGVYREEVAELGRLGCTYLQIDECALPVICDPRYQRRIRERGESWQHNVQFYIDAVNEVIRDRPANMTVCMHMCRGNREHGMSSGGYDPIAEQLFTQLNVDGFLLEYDTPRAGDFGPLRFMPKDKTAVLGIVSTKLREVEPADSLKKRIEQAAHYKDVDQLAICPQCGFASSFTTDRLTEDDEERKLARVVEVADAVWA